MRRLPLDRLLALALLAFAAACGGDDKKNEVPPPTWTWVPTSGSECSDGSQTGIGVQRGPGTSPNLIVFLNGGGACWDAFTCYTLHSATTGPYGAAELDRDVRAIPPGSIFDRTAPGNPYKDYTFVFVPYCTGDVHAGDAVQTYTGAPAGQSWHHKGRVNLQKALDYLAANLPAPPKLVVSGSSAGGFGSLLAFDLASARWPSAKGYVVDDSGPPLANIPAPELAAWYASWDLAGAVTPICGPTDCAPGTGDLSNVFPKLAAKHPTARMALLSSLQDGTMRSFFGGMPAGEFENGLRALATKIEDATDPGQTHAFVVAGTSHTMLGAPAAFTSQGVGLFEWLRRQAEDDPSWAPEIPPL